MKRPYIVHLSLFQTSDFLNLRVVMGIRNHLEPFSLENLSPWKQIRNFLKKQFSLQIVVYSYQGIPLFEKKLDTNIYGEMSTKIPLTGHKKDEIHKISFFELSSSKEEPWPLGSFSPIPCPSCTKVVISDFDHTLVETKHKNAKEIIHSLKRPVDSFPRLASGVSLFSTKIKQGAIPFILSASPHFFSETIENWVHKQGFAQVSLHLKDYRKIFSFGHSKLEVPDMAHHEFYKLNELLSIILLTNLPEEISLIGDGGEGDPFVYSLLAYILKNPQVAIHHLKEITTRQRWNTTQEMAILNALFELETLKKQKEVEVKIEIFIRQMEKSIESSSWPSFLQEYLPLIHFYYDTAEESYE